VEVKFTKEEIETLRNALSVSELDAWRSMEECKRKGLPYLAVQFEDRIKKIQPLASFLSRLC